MLLFEHTHAQQAGWQVALPGPQNWSVNMEVSINSRVIDLIRHS